MTSARVAVAVLLLVAGRVEAQNRSFETLRRDGNGIAALSATITRGFSDVLAGKALRVVADDARLNLTVDSRLAGLDAKISVPAHGRTAAVALLEIAAQSHLLIRVSSTGELVVAAATEAIAAPRVAATDTNTREPVVLPAVHSQATRIERETFESRSDVGGVTITARDLAAAPRFFAEADVLRTAQTLPGVEARNDYAAGMNVQGGEADQNLILLDGYPIYNPFHLGGVFGTFIEPAVGRVDLETAGFPSRYGGRLSGVLDVRSAEDGRAGVHGTTNISLLASTLWLGGAFGDGNGSWSVAGRRTYADAFLNLIHQNLFPYHFQDAQAHVSRRLPGNIKLSATVYDGADVANIHPSSGEPHSFEWGNQVVGVTVSKTLAKPTMFGRSLGDSVLLEQRLSSSAFSTNIRISGGALDVAGRVEDARTGGTLTSYSGTHQRTLGYDVSGQRLTYSTNTTAPLVPVGSSGHKITATGVYANDQWRPKPSLIVDIGGRVDAVAGLNWAAFLPRVSAKYVLTPDVAVSAAVGEYSQWMRSLGREDVPIRPLDLWVASDSAFPPSTARHYVVGVERWVTPTRYVRFEGFLKQYRGLVEPNALDDANVDGDEFLRLKGRSFGGDVLVRELETERFNGWLSYTYMLATRTDATGFRYSPGQDRRHDLNVVANWRLRRYTIGTRLILATGTPYTEITGEYERRAYDPATQRWSTPGINDRQFLVGTRDGGRLPLTSRVDFSVTRTTRPGGVVVSPYLSIINVLAHGNVYGYGYDYSRSPPVRTALPGFPLFPTVGMSIVW